MLCKKIFLSILALALVLTVACSNGPKPDQTVGDFINALKQADYEKASTFLVPDSKSFQSDLKLDDEKNKELSSLIFARLTSKTVSSSINGETAIITTNITTLDLPIIVGNIMGVVMPMAFASAFSGDNDKKKIDEMVNQYMVNALKNPNAPMTTTEAKFTLKKTNGTWLITPDEDLANALTGNLIKAFSQFEKK